MSRKFICKGKIENEKKYPHNFEYVWIIEDFYKIFKKKHTRDYLIYSDTISVSGRKWCMSLKACEENEFKLSGLYLNLVKARKEGGETSVEIDWDMSFLDKDGEKMFKYDYHNTFLEGTNFGVANIITAQHLMGSDLTIKLKVYEKWKECLSYVPAVEISNSKGQEVEEEIKLLKDFLNLKETGDFSDFEIKVADELTFKVHKNILAARSEYFNRLFASGMKENSENELLITDFSVNAVDNMLVYIYTGEIKLPPPSGTIIEDYFELLAIADKYLLKSMKNICEQRLMDMTSYTNYYEIYDRCQNDSTESVKKFLASYIKMNIDKLQFDIAFQHCARKRPGDYVEFLIPKKCVAFKR